MLDTLYDLEAYFLWKESKSFCVTLKCHSVTEEEDLLWWIKSTVKTLAIKEIEQCRDL